MSNPNEEFSYVTKIKLDSVNQNRELISSNKTLKLFTFTKKFDHIESNLTYQNQSEHQEKYHSQSTRDENISKVQAAFTNMEHNNNNNNDTNLTTSLSGRTVDDLLKILSSRASSGSRISAATSKPPPPLPPKPKSTAITDRGFMRFFSSNKQSNSTNIDKSDVVDYSYNNQDLLNKSKNDNFSDNNYKTSQMTNRHENNAGYAINLNTSRGDTTGIRKFIELSDHFPHESTATKQPIELIDNNDHYSGSSSIIQQQPIVTESPEEANDNYGGNVFRQQNKSLNDSRNISTVEILELPCDIGKQQKLNNTYGIIKENNDSKINTKNNQTFSRSYKQQEQPRLYYENNNSYNETSNPVIVSSASGTATDEENDKENDFGGDIVVDVDDEQRNQERLNDNNYVNKIMSTNKTEMFVDECSMNESAKDKLNQQKQRPPRTSTPNEDLSSDNSTTKNKNHEFDCNNAPTTNYNKNDINNKIRNNDEENIEVEEEDTFNISRETDELTNNSGLNQSGGGCELIGVNDSDLKNSPNSSNSKETKMPYTVQFFNETTMSTSITPSRVINIEENNNKNQKPQQLENSHSVCNDRINDLQEQTKILTKHVNKLQAQVDNLMKKIIKLENQNDEQEKSFKNNNKYYNNEDNSPPSTFNTKSHSFAPIADDQNLSQSPTNVGRILSANIIPTASENSMSTTYSRNNIATISSRNLNSNNDLLSSSFNHNNNNYNTNRLMPSSQSCHNSVTKSLKKNNVHASINSLYPESINSSISPTSNYNQNQQQYKRSTSPNSMISSISTRRDNNNYHHHPLTHASMLSLSSLGCQSNSTTLRKGTAVSGSISNLSQVGSQLIHWPSVGDFVTTKHRGKEILFNPDKRLIEMMLYNNLINIKLPNTINTDDYNLDKIVEPPNVKLKLDWVYGYRGRDCRTNLFYLATGECVYFVASIVVLYDPEQKTQRHYLGHTDSVKCLAVHPNKLTIASGQSAVLNRKDRRPIVRVWNIVNLQTLRVIGFNEDFDRSICCLAFSKHDNGATLAVVDESTEHTITLLDWQRDKNWRLAETNSGHDPVLAIDFHPIDKYSLVAIGRSTINFWDTRGMTMTKKAGLFDKYDKPKYVLCLTFNDLGETITGDSNGNVIIWPRGSNRPKKIIHDCHNGGVFSILTMKDGTYLTGGRDRRIIEWDENFVQTGKEAELPEHCGGVRYITYAKGSQVLIGTLRNSILLGSLENNFVLIMQGHAEATTAIAIHPTKDQYLTGGFDDQIHVFNSRTHDVIWNKCLMMPATAASFSPNGCLLIIGSTLGKWIVIDAITQEILFTKCDGSGTINCIKFSPDGEFFSMGSSDMQIYIYQTTEAGNKFCRIGTCVGHSAPIKEIDWSDDGRYLQSQSMNFELLYWKGDNCRPLEDQNIISDLKWFTQNCTIGFNVIGLWSDSIDSALINNCDRSNDGDLIVSATDTGNINIFKWPPCYNQCLSQKYYGNVEKFDFIRFSYDDSKLIAIGAKSCVTTEWTIDKGI